MKIRRHLQYIKRIVQVLPSSRDYYVNYKIGFPKCPDILWLYNSADNVRSIVSIAFPHAKNIFEPVLHVLESPDDFMKKWPQVVDSFLKALDIRSSNDRNWLVEEEDHIAIWKILNRYEQWHLWWEKQPIPKRTYPSKFSREEAYRLKEEGLSLSEIARQFGVSRQAIFKKLKGSMENEASENE